MRTIEEYEVEIQAKMSMIQKSLSRFEQNIGRIGQVIGKDASYVYKVLKENFESIVNNYKNSVSRNPLFLMEVSEGLDKIMSVLQEVDAALDKIEEAPLERALDVRYDVNDTMERIAETAIDTVDEAATRVSEAASSGTGISQSVIYPLVIGGTGYFLGRTLNLSKIASLALGIGAYYVISKGK